MADVKHRFEQKPAFRVAGLSEEMNPQNAPERAPMLWDTFMRRIEDVAEGENAAIAFGVEIYPADFQQHHRFRYMACIEVGEDYDPPEGISCQPIPTSDYVVFEHHGPVSLLGQTIQRAYNEWLPQLKLRPTGCFDLERYDERFQLNEPESVMEFWIPIQRD